MWFREDSSRCHVISGAVRLDDLIGRNWLESLFFTRTLEDNISGSTDWIHAILDLLESPCLGLYVYQILDELDE